MLKKEIYTLVMSVAMSWSMYKNIELKGCSTSIFQHLLFSWMIKARVQVEFISYNQIYKTRYIKRDLRVDAQFIKAIFR